MIKIANFNISVMYKVPHMIFFINHDDNDSFDDTVEFNDQVKSQYEDFKFFKTFSLLYFILFSRGTEIFIVEMSSFFFRFSKELIHVGQYRSGGYVISVGYLSGLIPLTPFPIISLSFISKLE